MTAETRFSRSAIVAKVTKLLKDAQLFRLPVDVDVLAERLGILVSYSPLEDDYSGLLVIRDGRASAHINSRHHPNRRRFSLAHELGHFVLHAGGETTVNNAYVDKVMRIYQRKDRSGSNPRMEWEANFFAAELLMPEQLVRSKVVDEGYDLEDEADVSRLAVVLRVSEQALAIRLTQWKDLLAPITDPDIDPISGHASLG